tara:strand:- start:285 stop:551 length:267 start_codon:yes stop_codon:yes gene_type:complete
MRKVGKKEARLVEEFNANKEHQAELQRQLRVLDKQGKEMRAELKQRYINVHGNAQSNSLIVTTVTVNRDGYTVAPKSYDKFSVTTKIA